MFSHFGASENAEIGENVENEVAGSGINIWKLDCFAPTILVEYLNHVSISAE